MRVQGDNLVETITFSLFSDLCLGTEEALLLSMVSVRSQLCVSRWPCKQLTGFVLL
jgi:hypothetical protein